MSSAAPDHAAARYDVVWPRSLRPGGSRPVSPRLGSLDGARIAFLWDFMFRGEELFPVLERELRARHRSVSFVGYDVFGNIHGPDEAAVVAGLAAELRRHRVDAVVCGNGC